MVAVDGAAVAVGEHHPTRTHERTRNEAVNPFPARVKYT